MSFIEQAFENWQGSLVLAYDTVFSDPKDWNPDVWNMVKELNAVMVIIGASMLGIFFFIGIYHQYTDVRQLKQIEFWVGPLLRLAVANTVMVMSLDLMVQIYVFCQSLMARVAHVSPASYNMNVPRAVIGALEDVSWWQSPLLGIVGIVVLFMCLVLSVMLLVTVWGRFLRLYLYTAIAPVFLAFGAGSATQSAAVTFLKSWFSVCMQGVVIVLALVIYTKLIVSDNSLAVNMILSGDTMGGILRYIRDFAIGAIVTLGICKGADQLISKMIGW